MARSVLGDWFAPQTQSGVDDSDLLDELHRQDSAADGFLVGPRTFEDLRATGRADGRPHGISRVPDRVQKYVVSSTMTDPQWQNSTVLSGDPSRGRALKEGPGRDIVVTGSITLCHTLIEAGLVDEYRLFVYPAVQGRGRRLFPDGFECPRLRLPDAKSFRSGITTLGTPVRDLDSSQSRIAVRDGQAIGVEAPDVAGV